MKEKNYWQKLLISTILKKEASLTLRLRQGFIAPPLAECWQKLKKRAL